MANLNLRVAGVMVSELLVGGLAVIEPAAAAEECRIVYAVAAPSAHMRESTVALALNAGEHRPLVNIAVLFVHNVGRHDVRIFMGDRKVELASGQRDPAFENYGDGARPTAVTCLTSTTRAPLARLQNETPRQSAR